MADRARLAQLAVRDSRSFQRESAFGALYGGLARAQQYRDNWDGYGARGPDTSTALLTQKLLEYAHRATLNPCTVVASADGGIATYFMSEEKVAYIEFKNSGEAVLAMYGRPDSPSDVVEVDPTEWGFGEAFRRIATHLAS